MAEEEEIWLQTCIYQWFLLRSFLTSVLKVTPEVSRLDRNNIQHEPQWTWQGSIDGSEMGR